jgi:hypothetical protein
MDNNQTNIQKADEITGYLNYLGVIPGKQEAYVGFLTSHPSALTSLGVLFTNMGQVLGITQH